MCHFKHRTTDEVTDGGLSAALLLYVLLHIQFRCPQYPSLNTEQICWHTCELSAAFRGSSEVNSERAKGITLSCSILMFPQPAWMRTNIADHSTKLISDISFIMWTTCWPAHRETADPGSDGHLLMSFSLLTLTHCFLLILPNKDFNLPDVNKVNLTKLWCAASD